MRSALLTMTLAFALAGAAAAQSTPNLLQFQARLADAAGNPLNGPVIVQVLLYNAPIGGAPLWSEFQSTTALSGVVTVTLGAGTALPANLFDGTSRYLALKVGVDPEMTPRREIVAVPYAMKAATAHALDASAVLPAGLINSASVLDGSLTNADVSGAAAIAGTKVAPNFGAQSVVTTGPIGAGTASPQATMHVKSAAFPVLLAERTSAGTNVAATAARFVATTSALMADGFGPLLVLSAADSASGPNDLVRISAVRDGASTSGKLVVRTLSNGAESGLFQMNAAGRAAIGTDPFSNAMLRVASTGGDTAIRAENNANGAAIFAIGGVVSVANGPSDGNAMLAEALATPGNTNGITAATASPGAQ